MCYELGWSCDYLLSIGLVLVVAASQVLLFEQTESGNLQPT